MHLHQIKSSCYYSHKCVRPLQHDCARNDKLPAIFSTTKKKLRPNSLFALTEEDQREDLEIFVVNNQERETSVKVLRSE